MCNPPSEHSSRWYYTLKMNYDHNNLLIFSRFHRLLSLTLVRHQCAEMKVSRQLMGHFHRAGHTFTFLIIQFLLYFHNSYYNQTRNQRKNLTVYPSMSLSMTHMYGTFLILFILLHTVSHCLPYNIFWCEIHIML